MNRKRLKGQRSEDGDTERKLVEQQLMRHETCHIGGDTSEQSSLAVFCSFDHGLLSLNRVVRRKYCPRPSGHTEVRLSVLHGDGDGETENKQRKTMNLGVQLTPEAANCL